MAELFIADPRQGEYVAARLPRFSLEVSAASTDGWHKAALVRTAVDPAFYLRSIAVPWTFVIARPAPSTRQSNVVIRAGSLSPARTSPARKLVVNWAWRRVETGSEHLEFYVRRVGPLLLSARPALPLRLRLKEQSAPQRRFVVRVASSQMSWRVETAAIVGGRLHLRPRVEAPVLPLPPISLPG